MTAKRVCCVEGLWDWRCESKEPTIKPMLEMLSQWNYWPHVHVQCGTVDLAEAFLREKWRKSADNSVLFFATDGKRGSMLALSKGQTLSLGDLADRLRGQCAKCYVHFSACYVVKDKAAVVDFPRVTGAAAVSGYRTDVGWGGGETRVAIGPHAVERTLGTGHRLRRCQLQQEARRDRNQCSAQVQRLPVQDHPRVKPRANPSRLPVRRVKRVARRLCARDVPSRRGITTPARPAAEATEQACASRDSRRW